MCTHTLNGLMHIYYSHCTLFSSFLLFSGLFFFFSFFLSFFCFVLFFLLLFFFVLLFYSSLIIYPLQTIKIYPFPSLFRLLFIYLFVYLFICLFIYLSPLFFSCYFSFSFWQKDGSGEDRTHDLVIMRHTLYRLSHTPFCTYTIGVSYNKIKSEGVILSMLFHHLSNSYMVV